MTESIRLPASTLKPSTVALPGSKSISNRTLLLAALSDTFAKSILCSNPTIPTECLKHSTNSAYKLNLYLKAV